jgi:cytidine deaminase
MKSINIITKILEYDNLNDIDQEDKELAMAAKESCVNAYAPYSMFRVGAAVRLDNGRIVLGTNIENAAFPSGICAERSALYAAASNYPYHKPITLAVAAMNEDGLTIEPPSPCGNCRQVIAEEEFRNNNPIKIILIGKSKIFVVEKGGDLLPLQFSRNSLGSSNL